MELTDGTLLGGRVMYRQPKTGYRTGIEPVLLAASVTAQPGDHVVEAGTGAGAGLLCLLARVPGIVAAGVEQDTALAALARANLAANAHLDAVVHAGDLLALPPMPLFDHVVANPPWHDPRATPSPDLRRDTAKRSAPRLLAGWARVMARLLRPGGSLTFAVSARAVGETVRAFDDGGCGSLALLPFWPRLGQESRVVLLRGVKGGRGGCRVLPGLVLHDAEGFTAAARAILWDGAALEWN